MTLASPSQSVPGTEITAAKINDPVNTIAAVVNGNIDDTNIASVSGSKLANSSITGGKIATATITIDKLAPISTNFKAYRSTAYNTVASTTTKLPFNAESWDQGSNFDTTTSTFTAPVAGYYDLKASMHLSGATARIILMIYKNNIEEARIFDISSSGAFLTGAAGSADVKLAIGDTIDVRYFLPNALGVVTGTAFTSFSGRLTGGA